MKIVNQTIVRLPREISCKHCGSTIEYDYKDVSCRGDNIVPIWMNLFITCPVCRNNIYGVHLDLSRQELTILYLEKTGQIARQKDEE
jgi:hypothetical protein